MEEPPYLDGAGSNGSGAGSPSASAARCDAGKAGAASGEMGWSVAAGTEDGATAAGIAPG